MRKYTDCKLLAAFLLVYCLFAKAQQKTSAPPSANPSASLPCDLYDAAGTPCVAAHSTTRALVGSYRGPLYQVERLSDGKRLQVRLVPEREPGSGAYADAAQQDTFCASDVCLVDVIYDQSGHNNHLYQAAPGTFKGPAKGAFDTLPIADMAPVLVHGHRAYGVYIMPGMGLRNNDASYLPVGDEPQGIYYVIDGTHFDSGCCFDYGNASTNGRAVGTGTMDTIYFGTSTTWGKGAGPGPWIMTDMEAGLFSGHAAKENAADPTIASWRFVTAMVSGGGGNHWELRGGDAQHGALTTIYSGARPDPNASGGYYPMRRQGGILLGTGGDNGNGSSGTFYEGVVTAGTPSQAATDAVQANIVATHYTVAHVAMQRIKTFSPTSTQDLSITFTNASDVALHAVEVKLALPTQRWSASPASQDGQPTRFAEVAPGASVVATFRVTSPAATTSGFLKAVGQWKDSHGAVQQETIAQRVRSAPPVKINEVRFATADDPTDQFVELYNASDSPVDLSNWSLLHAPGQSASTKLATFPQGTTLAGRSFFLLATAASGLAANAPPATGTIYVRSNAGLRVGDSINIDQERRAIRAVGSAASPATTVFVQVSTDPLRIYPPGTRNLPITISKGFVVGQKIAILAEGHAELATVAHVGTQATQTELSQAAPAGSTHIVLLAAADVAAGDTLILGTGQRKEAVQAVAVSASQGDVTLAKPLLYDHIAGADVSDRGIGLSFSPATRYPHVGGDAIQPLGSGLTLDRPLQRAHAIGAAVLGPGKAATGFRDSTPDQWLGSVMSSTAGSIALMDATGSTVVDAVIYGSQQSNSSGNGTIASPELAILEGNQSGGGCIVVVPASVASPGASVGRYPDGVDSDENCRDFRATSAASLSADAPAGVTNIKVNRVQPFVAGQSILVGSGSSLETVKVAAVGSAGAAKLVSATAAGAKTLPVSSTAGFIPGQPVRVGVGADAEVVAIAALVRRPSPAITLASPLRRALPVGSEVAGTGITLESGLANAHSTGEIVASEVPTPGKPNQYSVDKPKQHH